MKKILVSILGLSYSHTQSEAYAVVLSEEKGNRKIPVIINSSDAQAIALKLEGIKTQRPMTHDLFKSFSDAYNIDLSEVFIFNLVEGVFFVKLIFNDGITDVEIESTIGDALALSISYSASIYIASHIVESVGIIIDDSDFIEEQSEDSMDYEEEKPKKKKKKSTISELEVMLEKALEDENYEVAAQVRDKITKLKDKL